MLFTDKFGKICTISTLEIISHHQTIRRLAIQVPWWTFPGHGKVDEHVSAASCRSRRPANFAGILTKSHTRSSSQSYTIRIERVRCYFGFCPLPRPSVFECPSTGINAVFLTFFLISKETLFTDSFRFRSFRTEKESAFLPSSMLVMSLRFNEKFRNRFVNVCDRWQNYKIQKPKLTLS